MNVRIIVHVGIRSVVEIREKKYIFSKKLSVTSSLTAHVITRWWPCVLTLCFAVIYVLTKFFGDLLSANTVSFTDGKWMFLHTSTA